MFGARLRKGRVLAIAAVAGFAVVAGDAQVILPSNQGGQGIPSGSPLLGGQTQAGRDNSTGDSQEERNDFQQPFAGDRILPTEVVDTEQADTEIDPQTGRVVYRTQQNERGPRLKPLPLPNEFERFVETSVGRRLPRFGADLLLPSNRDYAVPATATVPSDYLLNVGDTVQISMTGSIEGSVERQLDTDGRIFLPRVGPIRLAGVRYGDLRDRIAAAIGLKYRNFTVNVGVRRLRGVRVYVTGFANNPGAYTVSSLSTLVNAVLAAGGPSAGGSFRSVKLYRNNQMVTDFDLYDLILRGDRTNDAILHNEDVLFIPALGEQVAVTGSVNTESIFELRKGESLEQVLAFAGGPNSLADPSRLLLYRQSNANRIGAEQIDRVAAVTTRATAGDIVQVLSEGSLERSVTRQSVVVRIEGEVNTPGTYYMPAGTPLSEVLARAGGLTSRAFVYGTRFERTSVRRQQRQAFREALDQLELTLTAAPLTNNGIGDAAERAAQNSSARAVLQRLREAEPDGRLVLDVPPSSTSLPDTFVLENNDRILIPARPVTVGVFGAVYRPASFVISDGQPLRVRDYVERAGGALRSADRHDIFVVRASGDVLSHKRGAMNARVLPGDVIFVPVKAQSSSFWARLRDISSIVFQFGLSAAAISAIT